MMSISIAKPIKSAPNRSEIVDFGNSMCHPKLCTALFSAVLVLVIPTLLFDFDHVGIRSFDPRHKLSLDLNRERAFVGEWKTSERNKPQQSGEILRKLNLSSVNFCAKLF
ncbi:hypothetical protein ACH5RR_018619 [Cinchona calisaya]|uniref:Uncharacterized protein n=1 Tax=Cinchona calisaya TaxID=153742 RepID=A0ABD2ZQL6_9GENT